MSDRRARRRQQTHDELLAATRTIARREGWGGVTIRKIAAEVDMTSAAIYRYVDAKDDLVAELVERGFNQLAITMRTGTDTNPDPLTGAVNAYVEFARTEPDLYRAMYGLDGAPFVAATTEHGLAIGQIIADALVATGRFKDPDPLHPEILILWATIHGLLALAEAGRLPGNPAELALAALARVPAPDQGSRSR